jgi:PAP2 superfamily
MPPARGPVAVMACYQGGWSPRLGNMVVNAARRVWRRGLAWRRLPAGLELAIIAAGYGAYSLVRGNLPAHRSVAYAHAQQIWQAERWLHINIEGSLNHFVAAHALLAETVGYYYGLLHFIVTPLLLAWLFLFRPVAFPRLRSALVITTLAAILVFWQWPLAPPRFTVPGMIDVLKVHNILGAANPHSVAGMMDLYAAMPSLHVAWATWCAIAVVMATRTRWRYLAWLYPMATTFVVLGTANHFVLDAVGGAAMVLLGLLVTHRRLPPHLPANLKTKRGELVRVAPGDEAAAG